MRIRGEREKIKPKQLSSNSDHLSKSSPLSSNPFHQHINESEYLEYTDVILQTNRFFVEVFGNVLSSTEIWQQYASKRRTYVLSSCISLCLFFLSFRLSRMTVKYLFISISKNVTYQGIKRKWSKKSLILYLKIIKYFNNVFISVATLPFHLPWYSFANLNPHNYCPLIVKEKAKFIHQFMW